MQVGTYTPLPAGRNMSLTLKARLNPNDLRLTAPYAIPVRAGCILWAHPASPRGFGCNQSSDRGLGTTFRRRDDRTVCFCLLRSIKDSVKACQTGQGRRDAKVQLNADLSVALSHRQDTTSTSTRSDFTSHYPAVLSAPCLS